MTLFDSIASMLPAPEPNRTVLVMLGAFWAGVIVFIGLAFWWLRHDIAAGMRELLPARREPKPRDVGPSSYAPLRPVEGDRPDSAFRRAQLQLSSSLDSKVVSIESRRRVM